jgi:predicted anti-sigma-YlaC factor YlaD
MKKAVFHVLIGIAVVTSANCLGADAKETAAKINADAIELQEPSAPMTPDRLQAQHNDLQKRKLSATAKLPHLEALLTSANGLRRKSVLLGNKTDVAVVDSFTTNCNLDLLATYEAVRIEKSQARLKEAEAHAKPSLSN